VTELRLCAQALCGIVVFVGWRICVQSFILCVCRCSHGKYVFVSEQNDDNIIGWIFFSHCFERLSCAWESASLSCGALRFLSTNISQGSLATYLGYGGIFYYHFARNLLLSLSVKRILKIVQQFWATVCKTVRPMLSNRCFSVLYCPVCLSVTLVYCGQTVGLIKIKLVVEVGLGPGHIVLDRDPAPLPKYSLPNFGPCLLWPNGWMDQDATVEIKRLFTWACSIISRNFKLVDCSCHAVCRGSQIRGPGVFFLQFLG